MNLTTLVKTRGTLEYFKSQSWGSMNCRAINGTNFQERNVSYRRKGIRLEMTKATFYEFCDTQKELILSYYRQGDTPSIDRVDNNGHYCLGNIRVISLRENIRLASIEPANLKARIAGRMKTNYKRIKAYDTRKRYTAFFRSRMAAAIYFDLNPMSISRLLKSGKITSRGIVFTCISD